MIRWGIITGLTKGETRSLDYGANAKSWPMACASKVRVPRLGVQLGGHLHQDTASGGCAVWDVVFFGFRGHGFRVFGLSVLGLGLNPGELRLLLRLRVNIPKHPTSMMENHMEVGVNMGACRVASQVEEVLYVCSFSTEQRATAGLWGTPKIFSHFVHGFGELGLGFRVFPYNGESNGEENGT